MTTTSRTSMITSRATKVVLAIVVSALVGAFVGATGMAYLSKGASQYFAEELRHRLAGDQESRGRDALRKGDALTALHYYRNAVLFTTVDPGAVFEQTKNDWSLSYPLAGYVTNFLYANVDSKTLKAREGTSRARLARVLESAGLEREAQEQYEMVATLMGFSGADKAKIFAAELMNENSEKSK